MKLNVLIVVLCQLYSFATLAQKYTLDEIIVKFNDRYDVKPKNSALYVDGRRILRVGGKVRKIAPVFDIPSQYQDAHSKRMRRYFVLSAHGELTQKNVDKLRKSGFFEGIRFKYPGIEVEPEGREVIRENRDPELPETSAPNYESEQFYLGEAPEGVDAHFAWTKKGGDGSGVRVITMESSSNRNHIDFGERFWSYLTDNKGRNSYHGTAIWGLIAANRNDIGMTGVAYNADFGVSEVYDSCGSEIGCALDGYFTSRGVLRAVKQLRKGDVLHIAFSQLHFIDQKNFIRAPSEFGTLVFEVIRWATNKGVHVIQAAGNSNTNLDSKEMGRRMDRSFLDSKSIIVGAATSGKSNEQGNRWIDPKRPKATGSNFGSRIDAYAPGEDLFTAGSGDRLDWLGPVYGEGNATFIANFGGTSGASAIIAGVVASISGMAKAHCVDIDPSEMRDLLRYGTPSKTDDDHNIGNMPDLRKIYEEVISKRAECN